MRHFYRHFSGIALLIGISRRQAAPIFSRRNSSIRCWTKTTRVAPTGNGPLTVADALRFVLFAQLLFPSIEPQRVLIRLKANPKLQHQLLERPAPEREQASPGVSLQQSPKGLAVVGTKPRTCCRPNSQAPRLFCVDDLTDILDQRVETIASGNCDPGQAIGLWMFGVLAADSSRMSAAGSCCIDCAVAR